MMRGALSILAAFCLALSLAPAATAQQGDNSNISTFSDTDVAMNAAIAEAQSTLPLFLDWALDDAGRARGGLLKVSFPTPSADVGDEIIWVNSFARLADGSFTGMLDNQPVALGDLQRGSAVTFPASAIQDWSLQASDGRLLGNYTTRVIANIEGNEYLWQYLAPDPLPPEWR